MALLKWKAPAVGIHRLAHLNLQNEFRAVGNLEGEPGPRRPLLLRHPPGAPLENAYLFSSLQVTGLSPFAPRKNAKRNFRSAKGDCRLTLPRKNALSRKRWTTRITSPQALVARSEPCKRRAWPLPPATVFSHPTPNNANPAAVFRPTGLLPANNSWRTSLTTRARRQAAGVGSSVRRNSR
jgi:hypothetical protein